MVAAATNEQDAPSRGGVRRASRSSGWSTTCSAIRSTLSFEYETRSGRDCRRCVPAYLRVRCTGRKGCGIYASLAIYVLRHTSSPALAPIAHHPLCLSDLPRDLPRPPALVHVRSFLSPSTLYGSPTARCGATRHERATPPPPHRRTDARPFRSTVSAGSCHHWTGLHTWYVVPINRDPVSSTSRYFLPARAGSFNRSSGSRKNCLWYSGEHFRFYRGFCCSMNSCRHAIHCERCFNSDGCRDLSVKESGNIVACSKGKIKFWQSTLETYIINEWNRTLRSKRENVIYSNIAISIFIKTWANILSAFNSKY